MKITKKFTTESAHHVLCCSSERCSHSMHGHSALIELELESRSLDNAGMVYDFGLMKGTIKQFIDSADHCYLLWSEDTEEFKNFIKIHNARWIELPFNPSAEMLSVFFGVMTQKILDHTLCLNNEGKDLHVSGCTYHETATGRAFADEIDFKNLWKPEYGTKILYSECVMKDWSDELKAILFHNQCVKNPKPFAKNE